MEILHIRPEPPGSNALARFNLELDNGIKLFGIKIKRRQGRYFVFGPNPGGAGVVTFPPAVVDELTDLVLKEMERVPHDRQAD